MYLSPLIIIINNILVKSWFTKRFFSLFACYGCESAPARSCVSVAGTNIFHHDAATLIVKLVHTSRSSLSWRMINCSSLSIKEYRYWWVDDEISVLMSGNWLLIELNFFLERGYIRKCREISIIDKNEPTILDFSIITIQFYDDNYSVELLCLSIHAITIQSRCDVKFVVSNKFKFIVGIWKCKQWT